MKKIFIITAFFILTAFGINELPQAKYKSYYGSDYVGSAPRPVYVGADGVLHPMGRDTTAIGGGGGGGGEDLSATLAIGNSSTTPLFITGHSTTGMKGSFGGMEFLSYSANLNFMSSNLYYDGSDHKYRETGYGGYLYFNSGDWIFSTAPSGSAGAAATHTTRFKVGNTGIINIPSAPVYADNSAATSGGLVAGDVYRTSTGVLMIVY